MSDADTVLVLVNVAVGVALAFMLRMYLAQKEARDGNRKTGAQDHRCAAQTTGAGGSPRRIPDPPPAPANNPNANACACYACTVNRADQEACPRAGIVAGEIVGWRVWEIDKGGCLRGRVTRHSWAPGAPMRGDVAAGAGVYAFAMSKPVDRAADFYSGDPAYRLALGTIEMWGDVVEHERGYRAEFARVASIDCVLGPADIDALRRRYGVTGAAGWKALP